MTTALTKRRRVFPPSFTIASSATPKIGRMASLGHSLAPHPREFRRERAFGPSTLCRGRRGTRELRLGAVRLGWPGGDGGTRAGLHRGDWGGVRSRGSQRVVLGTLEAREIVDHAETLARQPAAAQRVRQAAYRTARSYTWDRVARLLLNQIGRRARAQGLLAPAAGRGGYQ